MHLHPPTLVQTSKVIRFSLKESCSYFFFTHVFLQFDKYVHYVYDKCFIVVLPFFTGVAQGIITGIRGLCNGLGPALFGFIFYLFHVDLNETSDTQSDVNSSENNTYHQISSAIQVHKFQLDFMSWMIYFYLSSEPFYIYTSIFF